MSALERSVADVRQAARAIVDAEPMGEWHSYQVGGLVARQLGLNEAYQDSFRGTNYDNHARERLHGQALRAFNELAAGGSLVKVGRGDRGPDGGTRNEARFWTPAAFKAAEQRAADKAEQDRIEAERWAEIYDLLVAEGFQAHIIPGPNITRGQARGQALTLDLNGWAQLLSLVPFRSPAEREVTRDG